MHTRFGKYLISALLGLGLATLFRRACENRDCLVFRAPPFKEVELTTYSHGEGCYKFKRVSAPCVPSASDIVPIA